MDSEEWNEWRAQRGDEPGAFIWVTLYITDVYPSDEWRAREVDFIKEVEAQAKDVYEDQGASGLEGERDRIEDHAEKQLEQFQRVWLHQSGFELIASRIRLTYSDCEGEVVEDLEVVPRGAFVPDPDGPAGSEGLRAPEGPLVLRPDGETYRLEPTLRLLEGSEMPTDVLKHYSFGVLQVSDEDTWEDVTAMVEEQVERCKETTQEAHTELKFLQARREVYDALLERRAKGEEMPWERERGGSEQTGETPGSDEPPISGYRSPEYAPRLLEMLQQDSSISTFAHLKRKALNESDLTEASVDTVKRGIGYDDLPRQDKTFSRFKKLLADKVEQLEGER